MKARLKKKWGTNYAGQVLSNVQEGSIPADVADFYEDDDPAVNTVREPGTGAAPLTVTNDELDPEGVKAHDESQRAKAKELDAQAQGSESAAAAHEREQTEESAHAADQKAAKSAKAGKAKTLTAEQKQKADAGKKSSK
jgi:hypothetical protein